MWSGLYLVHNRFMPPWLHERDNEVELSLWVVPGASRTSIAGSHGEALRIRVGAVAEKGRANAVLIEFLSELLRPGRVELVAGAGGRAKRLKVAGIEAAEVERRLRP